MLLAISSLAVAVAAYGWSGLRLAAGSRGSGHPLRSPDWWLGTALQGVGFVAALLARTLLPLLLVQSAIAGALAVTAVLEHVTGVRRLRAGEAVAVAAVVGGIAAVAGAVVPGPTRAAEPFDLAVLAGLLMAAAAATALHPSGGGGAVGSVVLGVLSGTAFGVGAIAGRLLVGSGVPLSTLARFWEWGPSTWAVAVAMPAGIVVGQWALTRALACGSSVTALGGDYLAATVVPSVFGLLLLGEQVRPGTGWVAAVGLGGALWGMRRLLVSP